MGKVINYDAIEAARLTDTGENNDLNYLKSNGPRALPTSPTANNWSAEAIKKQLYKQPEIIFAWVKELGDAVYQFASDVDDIFDDIEAEEIVHKTGAETISGKKTFSGGAEFTQKADFTGAAEFSGGAIFNTTNVSFGSGGSDNAQTLHVYYTTLLHGPVVSNTIIPGNSGFPFGTSDNRWHTGYFANLNLSGKFVKGSYEYQLPEKSGTLAMTSDLATKADLVGGKVPAEQLPSYVDDVLEYANYSAFPSTGETGKIYVDKYTGYTYRWGGSGYVQVGGQDLSDYYTKSQTDSAIDADVAVLSGQVADGTVVAGKASKDASGNDIPSTYATKTEAAALDAKISKNAEDIATLTEALIKKDLYETQEATFLVMTAVPAGAMVKAYLDGFKGNSAVVNQLVNKDFFQSSSTVNGITFTNNGDGSWTLNGTATADANKQIGNISVTNNHTYMITGSPSGASQSTYSCYIDYLGHSNNTVVKSTQTMSVPVKLFVPSGQTVNNIVFKLQAIDLSIVPLTSAEMASYATAKAALKPKGMDVDYYIPYNAGTLTDSKPTKLYSRNAILKDLPISHIGSYTFTGQETWNASSNNRYICSVINSSAKAANNATVANFFVTGSGLTLSSKDGVVNGNGYIALGDGANIFLHDTVNVTSVAQAASFMAGRTIYYELATPAQTISQGVKDGLVVAEYDLTLPNLKSAGSVQDDVDGTYRNSDVATYTFTGNETWSAYGSGYRAYCLTENYDSIGYSTTPANVIQDTGYNLTSREDCENNVAKSISLNGNSVFISADIYASISSLTGKKINYAKASPTSFTDPISYPEIVDVYAGGVVEVVGDGCDAETKVYFYVEA